MTDTLNTEEAANILKCSQQLACELARRGEVPAMMLAGQWLFVREQLMQWITDRAREEQAKRREMTLAASKIVSEIDETIPRTRGRPRSKKVDVSTILEAVRSG